MHANISGKFESSSSGTAFTETGLFWHLSVMFLMAHLTELLFGFVIFVYDLLSSRHNIPFIRATFATCLPMIILLSTWRYRIAHNLLLRFLSIPPVMILLAALLLFLYSLIFTFLGISGPVLNIIVFFLAILVTLLLIETIYSLRTHLRDFVLSRDFILPLVTIVIIYIASEATGNLIIHIGPVKNILNYYNYKWLALCLIWLWWCQTSPGRLKGIVAGFLSWACYYIGMMALTTFIPALLNRHLHNDPELAGTPLPLSVEQTFQQWLSWEFQSEFIGNIGIIGFIALIIYFLFILFDRRRNITLQSPYV